ncbi:PepSY domain-containing protein [Bacillus atrophaeus]|nr:PepSY domain-containing protein [Bacillus atrophaeus]
MNIAKVLSGIALGTVISVSSLSSAHAAALHTDNTAAKTVAKQQASISVSKAKKAALTKCKGAVQSAQMKKADGVYVYVVKVLGEDGKLHTINVNCDNGKVVKHETQKKQVGITKTKAHSIALNKCKGTVKSSTLTKQNGTYIYIIKITAQNHKEQTVKVNAENGSICS